jgi:glucans biosynthesis protein C
MPQRQVFVDWLRIAALGLLMAYHVGMVYVSWPFHIKSADASTALEPWMRLSGPWRMSLLFAISGLATGWMLAQQQGGEGSKPRAGLLRERARRLLLPLLAGVVLIVPPQSYFEVRQFHGYPGSYWEFLGLYFRADAGFCNAARGCLILPTWNHLWFLPYLFVYTALVLGLQHWRPATLRTLAQAMAAALGGWRLLILPWLVLLALRLLLNQRFGKTHALVDDWYMHSQYLLLFVWGVCVAQTAAANTWPRVQQMRHAALVLAFVGWLLLNRLPPGPLHALCWTATQWGGVLAALGYAHRHWQGDHPWRRTLSEAVFPMYVFHQTVIILSAVALAPYAIRPAVEGPLVLFITGASAWVGYLVVRQIGVLRPWFGLANKPNKELK